MRDALALLAEVVTPSAIGANRGDLPRSFAIIRAEAELEGLGPVIERVVVQMIHVCGMVDLVPMAMHRPVLAASTAGARRVCPSLSELSAVFVRCTIGGRAGDTLGATVAITEVAVCLALMAMWRG